MTDRRSAAATIRYVERAAALAITRPSWSPWFVERVARQRTFP